MMRIENALYLCWLPLLGLLALIAAGNLPAQAAEADEGMAPLEAIDFESAASKRRDPESGEVGDFDDAKPGVKGVHEWAYDPEKQTLAAIFRQDKLLKLFDGAVSEGKGTLVNQRVIAEGADEIVYKKGTLRSVFVVLYSASDKLEIFEAATLAKIVSISTKTQDTLRPMMLMASPSSQDNSVLFFPRDYDNQYLLHLDVESLTLERLDLVREEEEMLIAASLSADGKELFCRLARPRSEWSHLDLYNINRSAEGTGVTLAESGKLYQGEAGRVLDPMGRFLATDRQVLDRESGKVIAELLHAPFAFLGEGAHILSLSGGDPTVVSLNDPSQVTNIKLARTYGSLEYRPAFSGPPPRYFPVSDGRFLLCLQKRVYLVDTKPLNLPKEPFLGSHIDAPEGVSVGTEAVWQLAPIVAPRRGKLSLEGAPEGVELAEEAIRWAPASRDIGAFEFYLVSELGSSTHRQVIRGAVSTRAITLDISPPSNSSQLRTLRHEGLLLIVKGEGERSAPAWTDLTLVDLENEDLIGAVKVDSRLTSFVMNKDFIVVTQATMNKMLVYSTGDLRLLHTLLFRGAFQQARFLGDGHFYLRSADARIYSLPSWERDYESRVAKLAESIEYTPPPAANRNRNRNPASETVNFPTYFGNYFIEGGVLYHARSEEVATVVCPTGMKTPRGTRYGGFSAGAHTSQLLGPWGYPRFRDFTPKPEPGESRPPPLKHEVLQGQPCAAVLWGKGFRVDDEYRAELNLHIFEIRSGGEIQKILVDANSPRFYAGSAQIFEVGDKLALFALPKIYFLSLPQYSAEVAPAPLAFSWDEGVIKLDSQSPAKLEVPIGVRGDRAGLYAKVSFLEEGMELDKKQAVLTFDRDLVLKEVRESLVAEVKAQVIKYQNTNPVPSVETCLQTIFGTSGGIAERILGPSPDQVFVLKYFEIEIENDAADKATRQMTILISLPRAEFAEIAEAGLAAEQVRRDQEVLEREAAWRAAEEARKAAEKKD